MQICLHISSCQPVEGHTGVYQIPKETKCYCTSLNRKETCHESCLCIWFYLILYPWFLFRKPRWNSGVTVARTQSQARTHWDPAVPPWSLRFAGNLLWQRYDGEIQPKQLCNSRDFFPSQTQQLSSLLCRVLPGPGYPPKLALGCLACRATLISGLISPFTKVAWRLHLHPYARCKPSAVRWTRTSRSRDYLTLTLDKDGLRWIKAWYRRSPPQTKSPGHGAPICGWAAKNKSLDRMETSANIKNKNAIIRISCSLSLWCMKAWKTVFSTSPNSCRPTITG